MMKIESS